MSAAANISKHTANRHAAARIAGAHEFIINLPQGYDTLIGERGVKLSGGEKQRLALARALLRTPQILILDEALSSVDAPTEKAILQRITTRFLGRTTILISHRLASVAHADRILAMEGRIIIEEGNHHKLMAESTKYREWYLVQQSEKLDIQKGSKGPRVQVFAFKRFYHRCKQSFDL